MGPRNYSMYALPAYYAVAMAPHAYAVALIIRATNGRYNNASPRSANYVDALKKRVPAQTYAAYERAKAAHANSLEILPLFAAALILANMAYLPNQTLNIGTLAFLLIRVVYTTLYIHVSSLKYSYLRTVAWILSVVNCMVLLIMAANEFCYGEMGRTDNFQLPWDT